MKRLISIISLTVVAVTAAPSEAQTVTYVNRGSVFNRAATNRTASTQRTQQRSLIRSQQRGSRVFKTRQVRALQRMRSPNRVGVRATTGAHTPGHVRRQIAAERARIQSPRLNRRTSPGAVQTRLIKRRLATEAEARLNRPRQVVR